MRALVFFEALYVFVTGLCRRHPSHPLSFVDFRSRVRLLVAFRRALSTFQSRIGGLPRMYGPYPGHVRLLLLPLLSAGLWRKELFQRRSQFSLTQTQVARFLGVLN